MTYLLSPFTDFVLQLLGIGPFWILYLGTVLGLVGLIFYFTDKTELLGIVAGMLKTFTDKQGPVTVTITPSVLRRFGLALLVTGIILLAAGTDATATTPAVYNYLGYGGPSLYHCSDLPMVVSWVPGICSNFSSSNSTSCLSGLPSPCWTRVQNGTKTCTINVGQTSCTSLVTFNPPYSLAPQGSVNFLTGTVAASVSSTFTTPVQTTLFFQAANNTNWKLIPSADTELYGKQNQRLEWTTPLAWSTQTAQFCINVSNTTAIDSPIIWPQYATSLAGPWTSMGDANFRITPSSTGFQCGFVETISLSVNTVYYFRVMGNDANGFNPGSEPDDLGLGLIQLYMTGTYTNTLVVSVGCTTTISLAPTRTSMTVGATCGTGGIAVQKTFTMSWWAGIPG